MSCLEKPSSNEFGTSSLQTLTVIFYLHHHDYHLVEVATKLNPSRIKYSYACHCHNHVFSILVLNHERPNMTAMHQTTLGYYRPLCDTLISIENHGIDPYCGLVTLHAPLAASAGIDPLPIQMSIKGCIGSMSLSDSRPKSLATET